MMGVDQVGAGQGRRQGGRQRVGGVVLEEGERPQRAPSQPARLAPPLSTGAERDELAVDFRGQGAGQFERVALAAAEQAVRPEWCWSDVDNAHAGNRLTHAR